MTWYYKSLLNLSNSKLINKWISHNSFCFFFSFLVNIFFLLWIFFFWKWQSFSCCSLVFFIPVELLPTSLSKLFTPEIQFAHCWCYSSQWNIFSLLLFMKFWFKAPYIPHEIIILGQDCVKMVQWTCQWFNLDMTWRAATLHLVTKSQLLLLFLLFIKWSQLL